MKKEPMPSGIRPPNDLETSLGRLGGRTLSGDDDLSHGGDAGSLSALTAQMAAAAAAAASNSNAVSHLVNNSFSGMSGSRSPLSAAAAGYHDEGSLLALAAAAAAGSHGGTPGGNPGGGAGGSNEPKFYEWDSMRMSQKMLQHSPSEMNHADLDASLGSDDPGSSTSLAAEAAAAAHKQSLRTLEKLLLSPHGASVAAAMGGDVAAAAAALTGSGGLDPSALGSIADVQHAMAILQHQQQQQHQSSTPNSTAGILPSMATFVGNSASSLQRR